MVLQSDKPITLEILHRHEDFVAINKPHGIAVHQDSDGINLSALLCQQLGLPQVWLLHRLDKSTSGVLLYALNAQAASVLAQQFADKKMHKTYLALSEGKPLKKQGWIKGGMKKSRRGAWKLTRHRENYAVTYFTSQSIASGLRLFVLQPHTGKTHQLRVAMKSNGCPISGDTLYAGSPADRLYLHACRLVFDYRGETFDISAPPDSSWLQRLGGKTLELPSGLTLHSPGSVDN